MSADAVRGRFKFAPILTATVLTILALWLFKTTAQVFVFLLIGVLGALYLGALSGVIQRRAGVPERVGLALAILISVGGVALLAWILVPPVIEQTRALIQALPDQISRWESGIDALGVRYPVLGAIIGPPGEHRTLQAIYSQITDAVGNVYARAFGVVNALIDLFAVIVMAIYLSLHPALYREWLIALFPPIHRDLVRDLLGDLADSLRAYIVGQLLTMSFLGAITALGLYVLDVPYWLPFGVFTALVAVIPFFGSLFSTLLPAAFVLTGPGYHAFSPGGHALLVIGLGVVVHLLEGNLVSPLVMSRKIDVPPVLTIMAVLVIGRLLGALGLLVALPTLVIFMGIVRRILITRIYEGQGFRRTTRERPLLMRLPVPGGGVLTPPSPQVDVVTAAERSGITRSA